MIALNLGGTLSLHAAELRPMFAAATELGATEHVREAVREITEEMPTVFGRLELLSKLQEAADDSLPIQSAMPCTIQQFRRAVETTHLDLLYQWLSRSWEYRLADMRIYFSRRGKDAHRAITHMLKTESYRQMVPAQAQQDHKDHFLMHAPILLNLAIRSFE